MKSKGKSILSPFQKFIFKILRMGGACYELVTGKTVYKLSFKVFNKTVCIEKYNEPAAEQK